MSLAGLEHGGQGDRHGCSSSLVAERQEWSCQVRSSPGLPSYAVVGAAVGAGCARVPPVSHGGFWKNLLFYVACLAALFALNWTLPSPSYLSACSGVWALPVEYSVLNFSGDSHLVRQSLLVLRGLWRNLHIFYVAVNSKS